MDRKYRKRKASKKETVVMITGLEGNLSPHKRHKESKNRATKMCLEIAEASHKPFITESDSEMAVKKSFKKAKSKKKAKCVDSGSNRRKGEKRSRSLENSEENNSKVSDVKTENEQNEFKNSKHSRDSEKRKRSVKSELPVENINSSGHAYHKVNVEGRDEIQESKMKKKKSESVVRSGTIQESDEKQLVEMFDENDKKKKKREKKEEKKKRKAVERSTLAMDGQEIESLLESANEEKNSKHEKRKTKEKKKKDKLKHGKSVSEQNNEVSTHPALLYLHQWKKDRDCWRFQKVRQTWLLQNIYNRQKVPDKDFKVLMKYLQGLKGAARQKTITDAEKLIENGETINDDSICMGRVKQVVQEITED